MSRERRPGADSRVRERRRERGNRHRKVLRRQSRAVDEGRAGRAARLAQSALAGGQQCCPGGKGLEAMRTVTRRYEPKTPGTRWAVHRAIITTALSKQAEEMETNLKVEKLMNNSEVFAHKPSDDDLGGR